MAERNWIDTAMLVLGWAPGVLFVAYQLISLP